MTHIVLKYLKFNLVEEEKLKLAHSPDYIRALKSCNKSSEGDYYDKYGLSYDCPPRDELYKRALLIYSSTMSCAFALLENKFDICLNWLGGWHHAKRSKASGFCYVNDINGAINYFVQNKKKVLYIDLGPVQYKSKSLFTWSKFFKLSLINSGKMRPFDTHIHHETSKNFHKRSQSDLWARKFSECDHENQRTTPH